MTSASSRARPRNGVAGTGRWPAASGRRLRCGGDSDGSWRRIRLLELAQLGRRLDPELLAPASVAPPGRRRARPPAGPSGTAPASAGRAAAPGRGARAPAARDRRPPAPSRPSASSASIRRSTAPTCSSSRRAISACANESYRKSLRGGPRHSDSASRSLPDAELPVTPRDRPSAFLHEPLEPLAIELAVRHPDQIAAPGRDDPPILARARAAAARRARAGSSPRSPAAARTTTPRSVDPARRPRWHAATGSPAPNAACARPAPSRDPPRRPPPTGRGSQSA